MAEYLDDSFETGNYEKKPLMPVATKWGTIGGAIAILISVTVYVMGETIPSTTTSNIIQSMLNFALYGIVALVAQRALREEQGDYLRYGRALGVAFVALMLVALLVSIWTVVLTQFLDPSIAEAQMQAMMQGMHEQGMTEAEIEEVQDSMEIFRNPMVNIVIILLASSILMVIIAAITAAFTKKNPPQGL